MDAEANTNYGGGKNMQQLKSLKINSIIICYVLTIHTTYGIEIPLHEEKETKLIVITLKAFSIIYMKPAGSELIYRNKLV